MKKRYNLIFLLITCSTLSACKKDFLEKVPNKSLLVPSTVEDFRALLDNSESVFNTAPTLTLFSTDDIYIQDGGTQDASIQVFNSYVWKSDIFNGESNGDWNIPYQQIFYANVVIDGLKGNSYPEKDLRGTALFSRAIAFYHLAQQFAEPYHAGTARNLPGIPLRLSADATLKSERGNLQQVYDQIITDLKDALELLPTQVAFKTRPSKTAALALLARVYQTMEDYSHAGFYADEALKLNNSLIDYNYLPISAAYPLPYSLPNGNPEVIYHVALLFNATQVSSLLSVDSLLYNSYSFDDLRKQIFFLNRGSKVLTFRGSYTGNFNLFAGLATDELYLIRAESNARAEKVEEAMTDLNTLLKYRFTTGKFIPYTITDQASAIRLILTERRKELLFRNLRWTDLRRLNFNPDLAVTLKRIVAGTTYELLPNSKYYTFPIPQDVVNASQINQNPR